MTEIHSVFAPHDNSDHNNVLQSTEFVGDVLINKTSKLYLHKNQWKITQQVFWAA